MLIIPAIDLKDHKVVRLSQGRMGDAKVYADDPVEVARQWVSLGATRLHLVDLNGAFQGLPIHDAEVRCIAKALPKVALEIGGGIRSLATIDRYMECGVTYCILGTAAVKDPELVLQACKKYPGRIILGLDAKGSRVATDGWDNVSHQSATQVVEQFRSMALESIIYTDISKDGMLAGMNFKGLTLMAAQSPFPVIASGGLTSLLDVKKLLKIKNIRGAIAGKALYEGKINLKEAIQLTTC